MAKVSFYHGAPHVTFVDIDFSGHSDSANFMLVSDVHLDNVHCDQSLFKLHLEQAVEEDAHIFDGGDYFCGMQGRYDPRADKSQLRPELQTNDYLGALVKYNCGFIQPYAKRIILMRKGNHETSILRHNQLDLNQSLVAMLNDRTGSNIMAGGYSGWTFFRCKRAQQKGCIKMFAHHGYGGAAPVSRGLIQTNRMAVWLPDADIVWTGHTHNEWVVPIGRRRINGHGTVWNDEQLHVKTPGYKVNPPDGQEGWETERGFAPGTVGCAMLKISYDGRKSVQRFKIDIQRMT